MSPSQAMNNHSPPSVSLHRPGVICSLHASVSCHDLAPAVCRPSTFFGHGTQMLCLCLTLSVGVCLFIFPSYFSLFHLSYLCTWPRHPNQMNKQKIVGKKKRKGLFCHQRNKGRSNLSSSLCGFMTECLPSSLCGIFPISFICVLYCLLSSGWQWLCCLLKAWHTRPV